MSESTASIFMWIALGVLAVVVFMALYSDIKERVESDQANEEFDEYQVKNAKENHLKANNKK